MLKQIYRSYYALIYFSNISRSYLFIYLFITKRTRHLDKNMRLLLYDVTVYPKSRFLIICLHY